MSARIELAEEVCRATALSETGEVVLDRRVPDAPGAMEELIGGLRALGGEATVILDVVGGVAGLLEAILAQAGFRLVRVSGLAVSRARQGTAGGESKSGPRDPRGSADQVRTRRDLRRLGAPTELDLEIRLPVGRRRDLVDEQTRRLDLWGRRIRAGHPARS